MKRSGLIAVACFSIFIAQVFALTAQLIDEFQTTPSPTPVSAAQAPIASPRLPQDVMSPPQPQIQPAIYNVPISAPTPQQNQPTPAQRVGINYQYTR